VPLPGPVPQPCGAAVLAVVGLAPRRSRPGAVQRRSVSASEPCGPTAGRERAANRRPVL